MHFGWSGVMLGKLLLFSAILLSEHPTKTHIRHIIKKTDLKMENLYLYILKHTSHSLILNIEV